ncbi:hypothetical protein [Acidaminococcus massiliensis]|uniref:hypothetical protein n=1 Tax=Acidaminococcus massiliensis TaxID=1852375 RepID=UPI00094EDB27|nr:hypothetical protein [Acidaminococcus massiliensis]
MEKQKVHPSESFRDEKMDELLQHIPDPLFFAKEEKAPAGNLDFATQDVLKFQFDLSEDERYRLKYKGRNLTPYDSFLFYEPGLKGMLAFFYALDRGYETVHLEEVDTTDPALCFRMEAISEKAADSCLLTFSYSFKTRKCKISKKKSINYFKLQMQKNFSDEERLRNYLRERFNAYCNPSVLDEEVNYFDRAVETVNFIRSLPWIFGTPLPALSLAEFLSPDRIALYETKKKQVNKDN